MFSTYIFPKKNKKYYEFNLEMSCKLQFYSGNKIFQYKTQKKKQSPKCFVNLVTKTNYK